MATDVTMPRLSDSMEQGTVLKWLVEVGDEVKRGAPLVEIETDKANMDYEADADGVVIEILAEVGETLPIGAVMARIGARGEAPRGRSAAANPQLADAAAEPARLPTATVAPLRPAAAKPSSGNGYGHGRPAASPLARRIAAELGLDLSALKGTGPNGRIVRKDVEAATQPAPAAAAPAPVAEPAPVAAAETDGIKGTVELVELTRLQQTVVRRMAQSKATAPDFQLSVDIDMSACVALRTSLKELVDSAPTYNDMVVKAVALALREFPRVNGAFVDGRWELYSRVNVGVAVAGSDALVVPTVFDADQKSLGAIARDARQLAAKVRDGSVTPPELSGGTFTVSNLGMYGIDSFVAVINPPQAAILAVGAVAKRAVVDGDGRIVARDTMTATLACDHRILYGADGAEFLARVRALLEKPLALSSL